MIAISGIAMVTGRRPMRSDSAGMAEDAIVAEIPRAPISHAIVWLSYLRTFVRYNGMNDQHTTRYDTSRTPSSEHSTMFRSASTDRSDPARATCATGALAALTGGRIVSAINSATTRPGAPARKNA